MERRGNLACRGLQRARGEIVTNVPAYIKGIRDLFAAMDCRCRTGIGGDGGS